MQIGFVMIFQMQKRDEEIVSTKSHSDFTIEHILKHAGSKDISKSSDSVERSEAEDAHFTWLNCTRFCPPRVPSKSIFDNTF